MASSHMPRELKSVDLTPSSMQSLDSMAVANPIFWMLYASSWVSPSSTRSVNIRLHSHTVCIDITNHNFARSRYRGCVQQHLRVLQEPTSDYILACTQYWWCKQHLILYMWPISLYVCNCGDPLPVLLELQSGTRIFIMYLLSLVPNHTLPPARSVW